MQIDPEDFRRHYALLSDDALLELNPDELVDAARPYYEAELADRNLAPNDNVSDVPRTTAETEDHAEDGSQLVATFLSLEEANFARGLLQSADIDSALENEYGAQWAGNGALHLMVPTSAYDRACEILESEISEEDLIAQAEAEASEDGEPS